MLQITPSALHALRKETIPPRMVLRFDAELSGGCSTLVQFFLRIDGERNGDQIIQIEEIAIAIDPFTARYLDETTQLDYTPMEGFQLRNEDEIWAEGIPFLNQGEKPPQHRSC